jgi:hypothetical protein
MLRFATSIALAAVVTFGLTATTLAAPAQVDPPNARADKPDKADKPEGTRGFFRTVCRFSHELPDDPIVAPGKPGGSHLHTFFGSVTTNASSTYESLLDSKNTCRTEEDASGYWVPALFKDGTEVRPVSATVYYRAGMHLDGNVQEFPAGFRMIAGDAKATGPVARTMRPIARWGCRGVEGVGGPTPVECPVESNLNLHIRFPECWDGKSLDSTDHKGHMAYGTRGACPSTHPVALPSLTMIIHYPIDGDPGNITLSSGSVFSAHADFFNAWDQAFLTEEVDRCINAMVACGLAGSTRPGFTPNPASMVKPRKS